VDGMASMEHVRRVGIPGSERHPAGETAEAYVRALISHDVDYLFLNPGTDTFPVQEALVKLESEGHRVPTTVLCLFETVALAAAHAYHAATGRPQAVLVHVDVGTQNLGSMLHDAQRGRAAVVIAAGRAPYTSDPALRGSRSSYIHWLQEQMDQHGIVRNYVKWDYELRRADQIGEVVTRAFQVAASDPPGPVYLTLPREILMEQVRAFDLYQPERFPPSRLGSGDPEQIHQAARWLVESERPVVLTSRSGRTEGGYHGLVRLAETLAIPVIDWRERANFPTDHPLYRQYDSTDLVRDADVILALDHDFPFLPSRMPPNPDAKVISIDLDPTKEAIPLWSMPVDLPIRANTATALDALASVATNLLDDASRARVANRQPRLEDQYAEMRSAWDDAARAGEATSPITPVWLGRCIGDLLREHPDAIVVDETVTNNETLWNQAPITRPGSWFVSGGSGLGWGLGAAMGVKLAHPDRPVLAAVGDGSFVFGAPLAALWAMKVQRAPVLIVIFNNACYNATKRPLVNAYPEGYSVREDRFVGIDILPAPRYDLMAQVVDGYGEQVTEPGDVLPALKRGLERVTSGQTAIIDVVLEHP
jgi:acetolactate synthase I/II/III large subunit